MASLSLGDLLNDETFASSSEYGDARDGVADLQKAVHQKELHREKLTKPLATLAPRPVLIGKIGKKGDGQTYGAEIRNAVAAAKAGIGQHLPNISVPDNPTVDAAHDLCTHAQQLVAVNELRISAVSRGFSEKAVVLLNALLVIMMRGLNIKQNSDPIEVDDDDAENNGPADEAGAATDADDDTQRLLRRPR